MERKLPIYVLILMVFGIIVLWAGAYMMIRETKIDAKFKEIGAVQFHEAELKAWKAGDCYVFGVDYQRPPEMDRGQPPVFFSNCQR